jgi:hypothetical protein
MGLGLPVGFGRFFSGSCGESTPGTSTSRFGVVPEFKEGDLFVSGSGIKLHVK